ncbi:hypothetical protein OJ253_671 [Cryptosporidium canis]|uniref:Uncharacterized protein n=1 Tax=Cryptosporidium canis TaxID=195482 RepID=A0A9D5HY93_9CRYT|nr:hypothetical protein OJ253_671 [Cryptosporidium canis]
MRPELDLQSADEGQGGAVGGFELSRVSGEAGRVGRHRRIQDLLEAVVGQQLLVKGETLVKELPETAFVVLDGVLAGTAVSRVDVGGVKPKAGLDSVAACQGRVDVHLGVEQVLGVLMDPELDEDSVELEEHIGGDGPEVRDHLDQRIEVPVVHVGSKHNVQEHCPKLWDCVSERLSGQRVHELSRRSRAPGAGSSCPPGANPSGSPPASKGSTGQWRAPRPSWDVQRRSSWSRTW